MSETGDIFLKLLGGLLLGIGILIATLSGLCTLLVLTMSIRDHSLAGMAIVVGGIPFVIGIALFMAGRAILRRLSSGDTGKDA